MKKTILILAVFIVAGASVWAGGPSSFDIVMDHYEPIRLALLENSMEGVNDHGKAVAQELRALNADFSGDRAGASDEVAAIVNQQLDEMIAAADAIASAADLEAARDGLYELTKPMVRWRQGAAESSRPAVAYCPMHKRSWLQPDGEIGNPYGNMPRCGEIVSN